jgi:hypothetical protein
MMKYKLVKLKKIAPLYLRGDLSDSEKKEFEEALIKHPELQQELREFAGIRAAYLELIRETATPPENLYGRILQNIHKNEAARARESGWMRVQAALDFIQGVFASPKLAWATAALFLVISVGVILKPAPVQIVTLGEIPPDPYQIKLNIVFKDGTSEKEIRKLLLRTGTQFVDGPDANGLYVLTVQNVEKKEQVLAELEKAGVVRFVAPRE